jgi:germination protein M
LKKFEQLKEECRRNQTVRLQLSAVVVLTLFLLFLGGCNLADRLNSQGNDQSSSGLKTTSGDELQKTAKPQVGVTLYFRDQSGRYLVADKVKINEVTGIARAALSQLCQGPAAGNYKASLPSGSGVRSLNVQPDGLCTVDLNQTAAAVSSPSEENLAVYAVVNTLTEFPTVKRVQILVNGVKRETLGGHIPIDQPLQRNLSFVKDSTEATATN